MKGEFRPHKWLGRIPAVAAVDLNLNASDVRLLVLISTFGVDDFDFCWPSQTTLADALKTTRQRVNMRIKNLVDNGYLEVKRAGRKTMYRVVTHEELMCRQNGDTTNDTCHQNDDSSCHQNGDTSDPNCHQNGDSSCHQNGDTTSHQNGDTIYKGNDTLVNDAALTPPQAFGFSNRSTRMPPGFPTSSLRTWATNNYPEVNLEVENKRFIKKYGKGTARSWEALYKTWIERALKEYANGHDNGSESSGTSAFDEAAARLTGG